MSSIVLDAGALIALERNDRKLWAALKFAALNNSDVIVPSTVIAQVWREASAQAQLAKALQHCVVASFDSVARAVGELCGRARTTDICDSHVAIVAVAREATLYASDPLDMRRLTSRQGARSLTIIRR